MSSSFLVIRLKVRFTGAPSPLLHPHDPRLRPAAKAIIKISKEADPPMRLPLGVDALHIVRFKCATVLKDAEQWEALSQSTVADDADLSFFAKLGPATRSK